MRSATVSSKGQITIPAELIRALEIEPGTKLLVVPVRGGIMLLRQPESLTDELAGSLAGTYNDAIEYVEGERREWS